MIEDFKCQDTEVAHNWVSSKEQLKVKGKGWGELHLEKSVLRKETQ